VNIVKRAGSRNLASNRSDAGPKVLSSVAAFAKGKDDNSASTRTPTSSAT